jgi:hypothetical protein
MGGHFSPATVTRTVRGGSARKNSIFSIQKLYVGLSRNLQTLFPAIRGQFAGDSNMETINLIHQIFEQYVSTSERLTDEEKRVWAIRATKADYASFLNEFGRDLQAAVLWVRCLREVPHLPAEQRAAAVRKQLSQQSQTLSGKTAQELEQEGAEKDATIDVQEKRIAELKDELEETIRKSGRK